MRFRRIFLIFFISIMSFLNLAFTQDNKYTEEFEKLVSLQKEIADIHSALEKFYPVALVEDNHFHLYNYDPAKGNYVFVKKVESEFPVSQGIRASFPLSFYDNKTSCVVSPEIFQDLDGYAILFHEFVHCYQANTVEYELKKNLRINQEAMEKEQYSWELDYDFPYLEEKFVWLYAKFLEEIERDNPTGIYETRKNLKKALDEKDYEYLVWQEWKEGLARYIENKIRSKFKLELNYGGKNQPYNRVTFYYAGDKYIDFLFRDNPDLMTNLGLLFAEMYTR